MNEKKQDKEKQKKLTYVFRQLLEEVDGEMKVGQA